MNWSMESLKTRAISLGARAYAYGRAAHYFSQLRALQGLTRLFFSEFPTRNRNPEIESSLHSALFRLLDEDASRFAEGTYPWSMLRPESPLDHWFRVGRLLGDGLRVQRQKIRGRTTEFSQRAQELAGELPRYYRRNFHFQKDGYLSPESAELYEHQVEILFGGAADAMRRMVFEPLVERWKGTDGRGLRFLEVGAGTGRTSRMLRELFPKAQLTVSELSDPYLKQARKHLAGSDRLDFVQCAGEELPFHSERFDAVISVFLFHELPSEIRRKVVEESFRVVKAGGVIAAVDSIQRHDQPEWSPVLEQFPIDFHEPFYRSYIDEPLEDVFAASGVTQVRGKTGFVAKLVWGLRPADEDPSRVSS